MRRPQQEHSHHHHHHQHHHAHHHHHQYNQLHQHPHYHHQHPHHRHASGTSPPRCRQIHDKEESRLARVKRALAVSLLGRSSSCNKIFGSQLDLLEPYHDTGVPFVVHRLCSYIETHGFQSSAVFRLSGGSPRVAERLRASFERRGDADLEGAACPPTAATLLRQYLKELPRPVVPSVTVTRLLDLHTQIYANDREAWMAATKELILSLPPSHYRLLGYLAVYLSKYEGRHGRGAGVCGVFAPVILPHVPPATTLLRDILAEATRLFPDCIRENTVNGIIPGGHCKICKSVSGPELGPGPEVSSAALETKTTETEVDLDGCNSRAHSDPEPEPEPEAGEEPVETAIETDSLRKSETEEKSGGEEYESKISVKLNAKIKGKSRQAARADEDWKLVQDTTIPYTLKPRKRKERRESCYQERKLIRSNSEERILDSPPETADAIRRVSSHEDFKSDRHFHILSQLGSEMGHGVRCAGLPLHERTNVSPVSKKTSSAPSPCESAVLVTEKFECDAERLRSSERFSRSITPRGRRQARRRRVHRTPDADGLSKENEDEAENIYASANSNSQSVSVGPSFLEMLSSGPSRSPSPARPPTVEHEDANKPSLTNWSFQRRQDNEEAADARVEAMLSPRNSLLLPRRFYSENEAQPVVPNVTDHGLKNLTKHINGIKKKIKKYEDEFEENFGYRPSHSDKMSNRDIKRLCTELNKLRKEHKLLKEDPISALLATANNRTNAVPSNSTNNNNSQEKSRAASMEETVKEVERKLNDKRIKYGRSENMEDLTYEQLLDEKTAVQKALLHIENAFGRPVSKEDRAVVRALYDKYRTLKRLLIRVGANKNKDSISELATILEHEAMDFTSSIMPGNPVDTERRASEPDMSHRGILDCIETADQMPTDSDSQHSSSEGSRSANESLHALPLEELLVQQRATREEKKRLRRALKELEAQFEARAGRRMQREDRGPQVTTVYESYKQAKAKLRLIDALVAKNA